MCRDTATRGQDLSCLDDISISLSRHFLPPSVFPRLFPILMQSRILHSHVQITFAFSWILGLQKANNSSDPLNSKLCRAFEVNTSPSYIHRSSLFSSSESRLSGTMSRSTGPLTDLICSCIGTNSACVNTRISLQVDGPITQVFHDEYTLASWGL